MTSPAEEATAVRAQITVNAPLERAFKVFTTDFGAFKPPEHNLLGVDLAETVVETHVGGNIIDRGVDGSECRWARILAYEPPDRLVISWDIDPRWQIESDPAKTSEVEVRFIAETPTGPGSSSNTATSTGTARAGHRYATASMPKTAGGSTCAGSPASSPADDPHPQPGERPTRQELPWQPPSPASTSTALRSRCLPT